MIGVIKRLSVNFLCDGLLRIYKSFIRPHLEYVDIIYDKPHNEIFKHKIENIQYKACVAFTGAFQGTSREHLMSPPPPRLITTTSFYETSW